MFKNHQQLWLFILQPLLGLIRKHQNSKRQNHKVQNLLKQKEHSVCERQTLQGKKPNLFLLLPLIWCRTHGNMWITCLSTLQKTGQCRKPQSRQLYWKQIYNAILNEILYSRFNVSEITHHLTDQMTLVHSKCRKHMLVYTRSSQIKIWQGLSTVQFYLTQKKD